MPDAPARDLPDGTLLLTDSGLETDLVFHHGFDLPDFAAFPLLDDPAGEAALRRYYAEHVAVARAAGVGIVLETPTWRASADWGARLGYDGPALEAVNRRAVALLREVALDADADADVVVSGCLGPRGDGYVAGTAMTADDAERYHGPQIAALAAAGVDQVTAMTITTADEAVGIVRAAGSHAVPVVLAFTVETDGRLPDGTPLGVAIEEVDRATGAAASWFMVNCAHPSHLDGALSAPGPWSERLRGVRANASRLSHAELDTAEELDDGDPDELADDLRRLRSSLPRLDVIGGCCGTDVRHIAAIAAACAT